MTQHNENRSIDDAVELLKTNGFGGLAEAVTVSLNSAVVAERSEHLGVAPYERSASPLGYANGYKDKFLKTRLGMLSLKVPQARDSDGALPIMASSHTNPHNSTSGISCT